MWMMENSDYHYHLEKFYWQIEEYIDKTNGIAIRLGENSSAEVIMLAPKNILKLIKSRQTINDREGKKLELTIRTITQQDLQKIDLKEFITIYDPKSIISCYKESSI